VQLVQLAHKVRQALRAMSVLPALSVQPALSARLALLVPLVPLVLKAMSVLPALSVQLAPLVLPVQPAHKASSSALQLPQALAFFGSILMTRAMRLFLLAARLAKR